MLSEKNTQISMMKAQINILMKELDFAKKNSQPDHGFNGLTPLNMVKKIRGGNHQTSSKAMISQPGDYNETEATDMPSGRLQNSSFKQGGVFITTANSIFTHRSTTNMPELGENSISKQEIVDEPTILHTGALDIKEKTPEKTPKLTKEEERAKISQNLEEFKKLHLAKAKKTNQGITSTSLSDRRGSEGLFGQFKSLLSGNNTSTQ